MVFLPRSQNNNYLGVINYPERNGDEIKKTKSLLSLGVAARLSK